MNTKKVLIPILALVLVLGLGIASADEEQVGKVYTYTDVCFEKDNDGDGSFSEDWVDGIDNDGDGAIDEDDIDCPDGTYLGTMLPTNAEEDYIVEAVVNVKNDKVKSYNPGQYYAVSWVYVGEDVDDLTIAEDWCDCTDISALNPAKGGGSVVIVQYGLDFVAYQILDAKSPDVTVDTCTAKADLVDVSGPTIILMYVKFGPAMKGMEWDGPYACENTNTAWVDDVSYGEASATLELIEKVPVDG